MLFENKNIQMNISETGGNITFLKFRGVDVLFQEKMIEFTNGPKKRVTHFCCPWFGKYPGNNNLPKHGFLREKKVLLEKNQTKPNCVIAKFDLRNDIHPHVFSGQIDYEFWTKDSNFLTIRVIIFRNDNFVGPVPFNFGFHFYFSVKNLVIFQNRVVKKIIRSEVFPLENPTIITTSNVMTKMTFSFPDSRKSKLIVWSDYPDYICFEPILCDQSLFNTSEGFFMHRGEGLEFSCSLEFSEATM